MLMLMSFEISQERCLKSLAVWMANRIERIKKSFPSRGRWLAMFELVSLCDTHFDKYRANMHNVEILNVVKMLTVGPLCPPKDISNTWIVKITLKKKDIINIISERF